MSAEQRRYRVRIAERGAPDVDGYVEFTLELGDLAAPPVVQGSLAHPLGGSTELRPLTVLGIDRDGNLIRAFTASQRWTALGRLCDLQWQLTSDDPSDDGAWTTYGVGRVSGLAESDGPGLFHIEISDESYAVRRGVLFQHADTTQLWPRGIRWSWRGWGGADAASGEDTTPVFPAPTDTVRRIELTYGGEGNAYAREITDDLISWINDDTVPEPDTDPAGGNFTHLRLRYPDTDGHMRDWEVIGFDEDAPQWSLATLESPAESGGGLNIFYTITVWIREPSNATPAATGEGYLYAPTAPPSAQMRLHLGVGSSEHPYGTDAIYEPSFGIPNEPGEGAGYLHVADLTRRAWAELGVRYDEDSLAALEQDLSFPALAPAIEAPVEDPHKWLQEEVWGPNGLVALRDRQGRMKLVDVRPPSETVDLNQLPVLNASNSALHRWRLLGREQMNSVTWEFTHYGTLISPERTTVDMGDLGAYDTTLGEPGAPALDGFVATPGTVGPVEPEDIDLMPHRPRTFSARAGLEPLGIEQGTGISRGLSAYYSGRGIAWREAAGAVTQFLLDLFQDGAMRGQCEVRGDVADQLEEGDYVLVDCASVKVANPGARNRTAKLLALLLSVTRYPAHAEAEYLVLRPADVFVCPKEDDESTWFVSPSTVLSTARLALGAIGEPPNTGLNFEIRARKNAAFGDTVDMTVRLLHGETVLQEWTESSIPSSWTVYEFEVDESALQQLSGSEFDELALEISRGGSVGAIALAHRRLEISRISGAWTRIQADESTDSTESSEPDSTESVASDVGVITSASLSATVTGICPVGDNFHVSYTATGLESGDTVRITAIKDNSEEDVLGTFAAEESGYHSFQWGARTTEVIDPAKFVTIWALVELIRDGNVIDHRVTNIEGPWNIEFTPSCMGDFN